MSALSCIHSGQPAEAYTVNLFGRPSGKVICCPPQMCSLIFNQNQEVVQFTGGYVVDKNVGNTGGLGGLNIQIYIHNILSINMTIFDLNYTILNSI